MSDVRLNGHERILDVGCGRGERCAELAHEVPDGVILGIDADPALIRLAESTYDLDLFANLQFQVCDIVETTVDSRFDLVLALEGLEWVEDLHRAFNHLSEALKPQGRLFLSLPQESPAIWQAAESVCQRDDWIGCFSTFQVHPSSRSQEEYESMLATASLAPVRIQLRTEAVPYQDRKQLESALACWLPHQVPVPASRRQELIEAVVEQLIKDHPEFQHDGRFLIPRQRLEAEMVKVMTQA